MNIDVRFICLAGSPATVGFLLLHWAARKGPDGLARLSTWRGAAFFVSGLLMVIVPVALWCGCFPTPPARTSGPGSPVAVFLLAGYLNMAFLWLIWNVSAFLHEPTANTESVWERNWGEAYSPELKKRMLGSLLERLDREGKIGDVVVDVGSGAQPVSKFLAAPVSRRFILVDIAAKERVESRSLYVRFDAEKISRSRWLSSRKVWVKVGRFLGIDPRGRESRETAATILFSEILNYVDYRKVIAGFARYLGPGGRIIVVNLPNRGVREEFSPRGLQRNDDLFAFLEEQGFAIETKEFPCRPKGSVAESEEMLVLVARKLPTWVDLGRSAVPEQKAA
jgi:hypothetical protein